MLNTYILVYIGKENVYMFKFHLCIFNFVIEINIFRNKKKNKTKLSVDYDEECEGDAEEHIQ